MTEEEAVQALGDRIGYGQMMRLAEACWRNLLAQRGIAGGEFASYCCVAMLEPCQGCLLVEEGEHCQWCCGARLVTKRVNEAIKEQAYGSGG